MVDGKKIIPPMTAEEIAATKAKAQETFAKIQEEHYQYEQMFVVLHPLLHTLSEMLYGEDYEPVALDKLVQDSLNMINANNSGVRH